MCVCVTKLCDKTRMRVLYICMYVCVVVPIYLSLLIIIPR